MENTYNPRRPEPQPALGVTLVSGTDYRGAMAVAAQLSGVAAASPRWEVETTGDDSGDFALTLADQLMADADAGTSGNTIVVLEPGADVMEVALVLEHVVEGRHPSLQRIGIVEVMAVTSLTAIEELIFGDGITGPHEFTASEALAQRLEFASTIVLTDLGADIDERVALVLNFLRRLSPAARVIPMGEVAAFRRQPAQMFRGRAHHMGASMGWQLELADRVRESDTRSGVESFVFRDPRPFHPARLNRSVTNELGPHQVGRILRSRGLVRLASRADRVGSWSSAGAVFSLDPTSMLSWDTNSPVGQEIVFFGVDLDRPAIEKALGACLLSVEELLEGPALWRDFVDPFPEWDTEHHH
ncbi:MAG TPA: GTP-binding protein [Glaciihabitans sp.]|jgi:G3E family GTPase|nr:GTP-binding protein [Glaciihabitans sp.]